MQQQMQNQNDTQDCTLVTIMNADGIYHMLLNLKLMRLNYYEEEIKKVPISEINDFFKLS